MRTLKDFKEFYRSDIDILNKLDLCYSKILTELEVKDVEKVLNLLNSIYEV